MNSLRWERFRPLVCALVAATVWYAVSLPFPRDIYAFLSASLSFSGILIGFVVTIQAILVTVSSSSIIGQLKKSGYMKDLSNYLKDATVSLLLFALMNLVGFFLPPDAGVWFGGLWVFLCVYALISFLRVSGIISKILRMA